MPDLIDLVAIVVGDAAIAHARKRRWMRLATTVVALLLLAFVAFLVYAAIRQS